MLCGFPNATEEEELSDQRRHLLEEASPTSALNYSCSSSDLQVGAARKSYALIRAVIDKKYLSIR